MANDDRGHVQQHRGAAISRGTVRRNLENRLRYEALCSVDGAGEPSGVPPAQRQRMFNDADDMMGLLSNFSTFDYSHRTNAQSPKPRRKTLKERTESMCKAARTTVRDEVVGKMKVLHTNQTERLAFFQDIRELQLQRCRTRLERGQEIFQRNVHEARCATPAVLEDRLLSSCRERDLHQELVQHRKAQVVAERAAKFEEMVKRANRTGVAVGDLREIERERHVMLLCSSWRNVAALASRAQQMFAALVEHRREQLRLEGENEARWELFVSKQSSLMRVQLLWRAIMRRKRITAMYKGADCIRRFLYCVPRIQFQFRVAVRRTIHRVVSIQRHFRAVRIIRQIRRDLGVQLIDNYIRQTAITIDGQVNHLYKLKKHADAMATSSIKARKPVFEAQAAHFHQQIVDLSKRKLTISALSERSKRSVVEDILSERENLYRDRLREFGLEIMEKYMIEFNIEKVAKERQKAFDEAIQTTSITELKVVSVWELKRQARSTKSHRPVMLLNFCEADAVSLFGANGALTRLAQEDFSAQNEQLYSSRRAGS